MPQREDKVLYLDRRRQMSQDDDIDRRELPEPPYPPDTALNGFKPQIDLPRIKASRTWLLCPQQYRPWLLLLP